MWAGKINYWITTLKGSFCPVWNEWKILEIKKNTHSGRRSLGDHLSYNKFWEETFVTIIYHSQQNETHYHIFHNYNFRCFSSGKKFILRIIFQLFFLWYWTVNDKHLPINRIYFCKDLIFSFFFSLPEKLLFTVFYNIPFLFIFTVFLTYNSCRDFWRLIFHNLHISQNLSFGKAIESKT